MTRSLATLTLLAALGALTPVMSLGAQQPAAPAADFPGRNLLSDQRWRDNSYGVSVLPPLGTQLLAQTADEALLRIVDDNKAYQIAIHVKRTRTPMTLKQAAEVAIQQISQTQGTTLPLRVGEDQEKGAADFRTDTLGGRAAEIYYVRIPVRRTELMLGQAVVQLDPTLFVFMDVRCELQNRPQVRAIFEAVLKSFQIADLKELDRLREQALQTAARWREGVSLKQLHAALVPEQHFRLIDNGKDIGYMRLMQSQTTHQGKAGIAVQVQSRLAVDTSVIDSMAEMFLADDDTAEMWTVKTTQRPASAVKQGPTPSAGGATTYVETGVRAGEKIEITIDSPSGRSKKEFERPRAGYLSQVETWLLPMTLPIDRPGTYGYYAYHSNQGKLLLRTDHIVPLLGGFTITTQLSGNEQPIAASYDADRKLVEKQLGAKRALLPTTPAMIQQLWRNR